MGSLVDAIGDIRGVFQDLKGALTDKGYDIEEYAPKNWADILRAEGQVTETQQGEINAACVKTSSSSISSGALNAYLGTQSLKPTQLKISGTGASNEIMTLNSISDGLSPSNTNADGYQLDDAKTVIVENVNTVRFNGFNNNATGKNKLEKLVLHNVDTLARGDGTGNTLKTVKEVDFSGVKRVDRSQTSASIFTDAPSVESIDFSGLEGGASDYLKLGTTQSLPNLKSLVVGDNYEGSIGLSYTDGYESNLASISIPPMDPTSIADPGTLIAAVGAKIALRQKYRDPMSPRIGGNYCAITCYTPTSGGVFKMNEFYVDGDEVTFPPGIPPKVVIETQFGEIENYGWIKIEDTATHTLMAHCNASLVWDITGLKQYYKARIEVWNYNKTGPLRDICTLKWSKDPITGNLRINKVV